MHSLLQPTAGCTGCHHEPRSPQVAGFHPPRPGWFCPPADTRALSGPGFRVNWSVARIATERWTPLRPAAGEFETLRSWSERNAPVN